LKLHLKRSKGRVSPAKFELLNSLPVTASEAEDATEDIAVREQLSDLRWIWSDFAPERLEGFNDIKWTYILDFDRDAFTINSVVHFRLSNIPENWLSYINFDHTAKQCMPKSLDPVHLAWDVFPAIPVVEQELLQRYNETLGTIVDAPNRSKHLKTWIMSVMEMELTNRCSTEFKEQWKEWTPSDRSMQKWVYAIVRCAMWDGLSFEHSLIGPDWGEAEEGLNVLLEGVTTPEATEYLVPVGTEKVLISLATHLEVEDIAKAAIGKVVELTRDGTRQIAGIISPRETIIVNMGKTSPRCSVNHTKLLAFEDPLLLGFNALIATLSTPYSRLDKTAPNGNLPVEIMEQIFKHLLLKVPDGFKTLPSLACTCKMFSAMARDRTFYLPGRLFYNHAPTAMPNLFWGWDVRGGLARLYSIGRSI
jgi:hypothetical protein